MYIYYTNTKVGTMKRGDEMKFEEEEWIGGTHGVEVNAKREGAALPSSH